jgi:competence protein ComEC
VACEHLANGGTLREPDDTLWVAGRCALSRLASVAVLFLLPSALAAQEPPVEITFLDVGQGDAILVRSPEGPTALIDSGPGVDLVSQLARLGVESLDLVVASHPHADHIGGMWQVLQNMPVRFYMDNGQPHTTRTYTVVMQELRASPEITYLQATPRTLTLGSVKLHILPLPEYAGANLNNRSVALVVEHGEFLAFFSGDSELPELEHFIQAGVVPDVTLMKAPHHGSDDAVSGEFLSVADPEIIVISVGYGNRYGHPKPAALYTYGAQAEQLLRTDRDGEISISGFPDGTYGVALGGHMVAQGVEGTARERPPSTNPVETSPHPVAASASTISISVFADAPGNDHNNPNGEYAILSNQGSQPLDISRWTLCDLARHCFTFPEDSMIRAGGQVVLFTGSGLNDGMRFYMGSRSAVWNNRGDTATLFDRSGQLIVTYVY